MKLTIDCSLFSVLTSVAAIVMLFCFELPSTSAKFCTKSQFQVRRNTSLIHVPCVQKFQATCPFSFFSYCTHYRTALCEKQLNFTYNWYHAIQVCCSGYEKSSNGTTCVEVSSVAQSHSGPNWSSLSSGAYAGIAAGGVLLLCIIGVVILVLYRQRHKKIVETPVELELEQRVQLQRPNEGETSQPYS